MANFCKTCGNDLNETDEFCDICGTRVKEIRVGASEKVIIPETKEEKTSEPSNNMALIGFILSIVNALACCGFISPISLVFSIIGLKKSKDYEKNSYRSLAIVGIVVSIIMLIVAISFVIVTYLAPNILPDIDPYEDFPYQERI